MATAPSSSSCPVDHAKLHANAQVGVQASSAGCPVNHSKLTVAPPQGCDSSAMSSNPFLDAVRVAQHQAGETTGLGTVGDNFPDSASHPEQRLLLSSTAVQSNIPKGGGNETWTYPSPQRFYNAMKKKGWQPSERDMPWVVSIHNTVNEQCWTKVLAYENFHASECSQPKLLKFRGKPDQLSLKAKLRTWTGSIAPFDRHDWTVDRCGKEVTYIIDFYEGKASIDGTAPPIFLDVRPAPSIGGIIDRVRMTFKDFFQINHGERGP